MNEESRYPWHIAPSWARWAAKDLSGAKAWYELRPEPIIDNNNWWAAGRIQLFGLARHRDINWLDSLEVRPGATAESPCHMVAIPAETAGFISGLMHGSVDNLQHRLLTIRHLGVLDAAIQVARQPSHGGPVCAYRCMGGPWDGRLVARRLGCTKISVHVTDQALIHAPDNERSPVGHFFEYQLHQEGGSIWWQCGGLS